MTTEPVRPMPNRAPMGSGLQRTRIVAVLETGSASAGHERPDSFRIATVADTLVENGVLCLALSPRAGNGLTVLEQLATRLPDDAELGLGAVLAPEDAVRAAGAGADFVMSPLVAPDMVHAARGIGLASYPGALTPSEVHLAWRTGATAVQLFPGGSQGPGYLAALRRALPDIPVIPGGGIECGDVADWLAAGAAAVVLGRSLLGDALLPGGDLRSLGVRTRLVCAAAADAPG
ncbi:bifunctional 4-hydroxy-2-oxoglutarate aldolase/2-dehydro-3-deoxy-phosphogluconate aldolase [Arthrobacter gengyunqii]|uniref:Bifunctional 4-hydroxy-2-oxoglutarate aldolase/2-dehydro-3-deoxy-phosphogluconate aldolase n=1 Tax=Arthrobacter gengyunqii TaxID=2886940 RepID=A0ABS8GMN8_9MICC|nr:bifunctional 4-hydroxy-2-oxoglutarate aldolase/2-dehydro-3-deoxy-phosphogluconate aldolase [Arthrobacter gengyunqii]MCC3267628.1 bifunctional 4-hydroxy-2-oxoglutarate aldolase/2-dehydro-3-deoxy-phosphogluconate aldolase [Arthrobacter gengyunqii]